jgi:small subunit ribosomal protein S5
MSEEEKEVNETKNEEITANEAVEAAAEEPSAEAETAEIEEDVTEEVVTKLPSKKQRNRKKNVETQEAKPESEWKEQVVQISRVTKVVKGGKKLSFRAVVIVGNKKGQVGVGCAKAAEVIIAIQKAIADGRKNLITVPIFKTTIPHPIVGRSGAGKVMLRPASQGTGIIAGGAVRPVLELAGIENILTKSQGSKSPLNAAYATMNALKSLRMFSDVAKKRGLTMAELLN